MSAFFILVLHLTYRMEQSLQTLSFCRWSQWRRSTKQGTHGTKRLLHTETWVNMAAGEAGNPRELTYISAFWSFPFHSHKRLLPVLRIIIITLSFSNNSEELLEVVTTDFIAGTSATHHIPTHRLNNPWGVWILPHAATRSPFVSTAMLQMRHFSSAHSCGIDTDSGTMNTSRATFTDSNCPSPPSSP